MTWTAPEIAQKLAMIRTLDAGQIAGWHRLISGSEVFCRAPFPGEIEAIERRAESLGLILTERGYSLPSGRR